MYDITLNGITRSAEFVMDLENHILTRTQLIIEDEADNENADVLETYNVHYIYVSDYERAEFDVDLYALDETYELIYANDDVRIYDAGWRETP